ncbi:hypothetical protein [Demequina lutea]|uniref:Uncharacterized protein n=1 Tax=Demequina lutea TaxID=431489 RepID=A0A7Y9ZCH8_9MICO|nr:hypothetical protein [Demequina lutea]NYI41693.1 hypothetical protein [Demequina lutea]
MSSRPVLDVPTPPGGWLHPGPNAGQIAAHVWPEEWTLVGGLMVALHAAARGIRPPRTTVNEVAVERDLRLDQILARVRSSAFIGEDDARGRCVHEGCADWGVCSRQVQGRIDLTLRSPGASRIQRG